MNHRSCNQYNKVVVLTMWVNRGVTALGVGIPAGRRPATFMDLQVPIQAWEIQNSGC